MAEEPQEPQEMQEPQELHGQHERTVLRTKNLRQITFISESELELQQRREDEKLREAGIARAYKQPAGTERVLPEPEEEEEEGNKKKKKKPSTLVMLMKSAKLKDPQWLPSQSGTWVEHFEAAGVTVQKELPELPMPELSKYGSQLFSPALPSPLRLASAQDYKTTYGVQPQWPTPLASLQSAYGVGPGSLSSHPSIPETPAEIAISSATQPIDPQLMTQALASPFTQPPQIPNLQSHAINMVASERYDPQYLATQASLPISNLDPISSIPEPVCLDDGPTLDGFERFMASQKRKASEDGGNSAKKPRIGETASESLALEQAIVPSPWRIITPTPPANAVTVQKRHLERITLEKEKDDEFNTSLLSAAAMVIPEVLVRLDCAYNGSTGVLLIKNDRSEITFVVSSEDPAQSTRTAISIPIDRVIKPSISVQGSRPMEFNIMCRDEENEEVTYRFHFGFSSLARNAANFLRAKIEDLRWALEMEKLNQSGARIVKGHTMARVTEAAQIDIVKPFKCETCGKRFKNRDGIIYHQKRSQTECNPNWTGPKREPKPARIPKKPKIEKSTKPLRTPVPTRASKAKTQSSAIKAGMAITPDSEARGLEDIDDELESDGSDDSVIRWFEQVNKAKAVGRGTIAPSSSRSTSRAASFPITPDTDRSHINSTDGLSPATAYERAQSQGSIAQSIKGRRSGSNVATVLKPLTEEEVLSEIFPHILQAQTNASEGLQPDNVLLSERSLAIGDIESKGSQDIVLKLIESNSGIFPGGKSLWYAFVPEFARVYGNAGVIPSSEVCEASVTALVADNKLKIYTCEFQDRESNVTTRTIITLAEFDTSMPMSDDLPACSVFATLKAIIEMVYPRYYVPSSSNINDELLRRLRDVSESSVPTWKTGTLQTRFNTPEASVEHRRKVRRLTRYGAQLAGENDDEYEKLGRRSLRKRPFVNAKEKAAQTELESHMWRQPPAFMQSENGAWGAEPFRFPVAPPKKTRARVPRKGAHPSTWQQLHPNLQNTATSAWDIQQIPAKIPRRAYRFRNQLPEPITYMQDDNGAWSFRPYGHGVKPIHQRPTRRAYGNPHYEQYFKQIETGFRPILSPKKPVARPLRLSVHVTGKTSQMSKRGLPAGSKKDLLSTESLPSKKGGRKSAIERDGEQPQERTIKRRKTRRTMEIPMDLQQDVNIDTSDSDFSEDSHFVMTPVGDTFRPARRTFNTTKKTPQKRKQSKESMERDMQNSLAIAMSEEISFETNPHYNGSAAQENNGVLPSIEEGSGSGLHLQPRYLTSLESRFSSFSKNSAAVLRELNLSHVPVGAVAKANRVPAMTEREEARFITAVVVIRSLTGGLDMAIDWVLIGTLFKKYSIAFLERLWLTFETTNRGRRKRAIEKYQEDFQAVYATAYASDLVPTINYDNLLGYCWNEVINWTMQKLGIEQIANQDTLERKNPEHEYRKAYFKKPGAMKGRLDMAVSVACVVPPKRTIPVRADDVEMNDADVAKSWARATVLTPTEQYNEEDAEEKLEPYANMIEKITENLHREKVLAINKGKQAQSDYRKYKPHSFFLKALYKKNVYDEQKFVEAVKYKTFLDQEFRNGKECVRVQRQTTENICLISLQAEGRVRLQPVDLNLLIMGMPKPALVNGQRQHSRKKNLEKYKFLIDIYRTDSYMFSDEISVVDIAATAEPPRGGIKGELPLWYDIHDNLIMDLWKKVLVTVVWIVHVRAGSSPQTLHGHFAPILEEWELRRLLEWGQSVGLFKRVMEGVDGWAVDEWWWMIAGSICAA